MKITILALMALLFIGPALTALSHNEFNEKYSPFTHGGRQLKGEDAFDIYVDYLESYKSVSGKDALLHMDKFETFKENLRSIAEHNSNPSRTYDMGFSDYTDMTDAEFMEFFGLKLKAEQNCSATNRKLKTFVTRSPPEFDWRREHKVTPVKNQGKCGSCWTFSTVGAMESHFLIETNRFGNFSEQQLVDCAGAYNNFGCMGGLPSYAFNYIRDNGMTTEQLYEYHAVDQACQYNRTGMEKVITSGPYNITARNETEMQEHLFHAGPISCSFQVASDFKNYLNGTYSSTVCKNGEMDINHAVLCVGYGSDHQGMDYWAVKNSWGTSWGMNGYFNIEKGVNMCGIGVCNSYPEHVRAITHNDVTSFLKE